MSLHPRIRRPSLPLMEPPQDDPLLVQLHLLFISSVVVRVAGPVRIGPARGCLRPSFYGGRHGRRRAGHSSDLDHRSCSSDLLREAEEDSGG